jgi:hypothetical protein
MAKSFSFQEMLVVTAEQKFAVAKSRSNPRSDLEKPKEAIFDALEFIADQLASEGYSFQRSGPRLKRTQDDLTFEISFQSDINNIAGVRAVVWIHAGVYSKKLAKWRRNHDNDWIRQDGPYAGRIAGAQIGNLNSVPGWMEWNFADRRNRRSLCEDAINAIREIIFPFFESFKDPEKCVETLVKHPVLRHESVIEYAFSNVGEATALQGIQLFLASNEGAQGLFEAAFSNFATNGVPKFRSSLINNLAALVVAAGIDLNPN